MNVRNCKSCGRLFNYVTGVPLCMSCRDEREQKFQEVKKFVQDCKTAGINEIVEQCGFNDANYFARYFRKCQGMSPSQYREENAKGREKNGAQCGT